MSTSIEEQLKNGGTYVSTTSGSSMRPMLRDRRDRVIVTAIGDRELKKYELPLYRRADGKYVLHRIIGVKEDCYVIRGDNTFQKEFVPREQILGYVTEFYRGEKHVETDNRAYRMYAALWQGIYPVRALWHSVRVLGSHIKHRIFQKKREH